MACEREGERERAHIHDERGRKGERSSVASESE